MLKNKIYKKTQRIFFWVFFIILKFKFLTFFLPWVHIIILSRYLDTFVLSIENTIIIKKYKMKQEKIHDINFLLRIVKLYLQKDMSADVQETYQKLLSIKSQLTSNS
jgi:hypothetical protein